MTFRLIHTGKGSAAVQEIAAFSDPTIAVPRTPQTIHRSHFERRQSPLRLETMRAERRKPYSPGKLFDIEDDACRYIIIDENGTRCGAKCEHGKSQCRRHDDFIHGRNPNRDAAP